MNIFDDAAKKMRQEKQNEIETQVALEQEQHKLATKIVEDFVSYMNNANHHNISPAVEGNQVMLRLLPSSTAFVITCVGADAFTVFDLEDKQPGQDRGILTTDMMSRRVVEWLQKHRPKEDQWVEIEPSS
jgi:hypothetical protein